MEFRTPVKIVQPPFSIEPGQRVLCVGSCFAASIGQRFTDALFPTTTNPYGVMYNPASILHTLERLTNHDSSSPFEQIISNSSLLEEPGRNPHLAILTLGTTHVYKLKETGEIVDNCQKRPSALFNEQELSVDQCADYLQKAIVLLCKMNPHVNIILTVSPIRYHKYGFHGSQLSKATLLLAVDKILTAHPSSLTHRISYFPAYEIMNDELRDYRFYAPDMLHPSDQAVEYIWQQFVEAFFSDDAKQYLREWQPIRKALNHHPFDEKSSEYKAFRMQTQQHSSDFKNKWLNQKLDDES